MKHWILLAAAAALTAPAVAQDKPKPAEAVTPAAPYVPQVRSTRHTGVFGGQRVSYEATIAETVAADVSVHQP